MSTLRKILVGLVAALVLGAAHANSDAVLEWNEIMTAAVQEQPPPVMNRFAAITQLAVFEAVNAIQGGYEPYLGMLDAPRDASAEAAVIGAAHRALRTFFPDRKVQLDAARAKSLARIPNGPAKDHGIETGEAAASAIIAARADDGSEPPESYLPGSTKPGQWQLTADCPPTGGVFRNVRNIKPFALRRGDQFRSDPPPALESTRYAQALREVQENGARDSTSRPVDRTNVARMYAVVGDAVLWNPIARQLAGARHRSLLQNAHTFALLNMTLTDAGIAVMDTKYHYIFWRPETAIVATGSSFVPLISAPCFPSYPSGHAATSYGAREVLEHSFGTRGHSIVVSSSALPEIVLKYSTIEEITFDIDDARIYGGIHFRFDQTAGGDQGRRVGAYVFRHSLRPERGRGCARDEDSTARLTAPIARARGPFCR